MPGSREDDFFLTNNAFSLYDLYCQALAQKPLPGVMKFIILVDPSLVIISTFFVCLINARIEIENREESLVNQPLKIDPIS